MDGARQAQPSTATRAPPTLSSATAIAAGARSETASSRRMVAQPSHADNMPESEISTTETSSSDDDDAAPVKHAKARQHFSAKHRTTNLRDSMILLDNALSSRGDAAGDGVDPEVDGTSEPEEEMGHDNQRGLVDLPRSTSDSHVRASAPVISINDAQHRKPISLIKPVAPAPGRSRIPASGHPSGVPTTRIPIPIGPPPMYPETVAAKLARTAKPQLHERQQAGRSSGSLPEGQAKILDRELYTCRLCDRPCDTANQLITHLRGQHGDDGSYPCKLCDKSYHTARAFRAHLKDHVTGVAGHDGEGHFLHARHKARGFDESSTPDIGQGKDIQDNDFPPIKRPGQQLKRHCDCPMDHTYNSVESLLRHRRDYHPVQPWRCTTCGRDFVKSGRLRIISKPNVCTWPDGSSSLSCLKCHLQAGHRLALRQKGSPPSPGGKRLRMGWSWM